MHEMSIAQSLIDIVRDEMGKHDVTVLKSVRIQIGQLSAIVPDSLSFCFNIMTSGTDLEGAELMMEIIPLRGVCKTCKVEFEIKDYAFECPECGSPKIDTISGQELSILDMEVE
jgi:hydrogenase nickel incorporation protein HypA/HybF